MANIDGEHRGGLVGGDAVNLAVGYCKRYILQCVNRTARYTEGFGKVFNFNHCFLRLHGSNADRVCGQRYSKFYQLFFNGVEA